MIANKLNIHTTIHASETPISFSFFNPNLILERYISERMSFSLYAKASTILKSQIFLIFVGYAETFFAYNVS